MFTRIDHVAIAVRSLEQAFEFYRDVLGLAAGRRATVEDQGVHAALFPVGDGEIELLEPADPAGGVARFLERRGEGLHHICVETPDVSAALAHAKALELTLIDHSPRPGLAGMITFLHPKASHGVLVELAQPLTPQVHRVTPSAGVQAVGIETVYVAVKEAAAAAATYARNFQGEVAPVQDDSHFASKKVVVSIGNSQVTLLGSADRVSPVGCFLADRGEGLFGICLRVADFEDALRYLEETGIPTKVHGRATTTPLARLDPTRVNGVNLFLCPSTSTAPVHIPAG
jgi:methylmalonyl-CoA/ethylmalonyl-CoA epimerase